MNASPRGKLINLGSCNSWLRSEGNIYSAVRFSYLSNLPDSNTDIFVSSFLILHHILSFLIFQLIAIDSFFLKSCVENIKIYLMAKFYIAE